VAQPMDVRACRFTGKPMGLVGRADRGRRRELAVDRHGGLQRDKRTAMLNPVGKSIVEASCPLRRCGGRISYYNLDSSRPKFGETSTADQGIRIHGGNYTASDIRCDQRVGTGAGAALVRAGFKGDVRGCALRSMSQGGGLLQSGDLSVIALVIVVRTFAEDCAVANQHTADRRIGRGEANGLLREIQGALQVTFIVRE